MHGWTIDVSVAVTKPRKCRSKSLREDRRKRKMGLSLSDRSQRYLLYADDFGLHSGAVKLLLLSTENLRSEPMISCILVYVLVAVLSSIRVVISHRDGGRS
jgi:hypothetical protein